MPEIDVARALYTLSYAAIPAIFAITVHEVAHGWVAKQCGDPTAAFAGRLTLNPIRHIDPIGTVVVPIVLLLFSPFVFGWAKPVPVAFNNLDKPKRDMVLVAAAGPGVNLIMALIWALFGAIQVAVLSVAGIGSAWLLEGMTRFGITINVVLAVFNMLPIPPLDGGRVLAGFAPRAFGDLLDRIEPFGLFIVVGLMFFGVLGRIIYPPVVFLSGVFESVMRLGLL
jgi:Zn-dependent protease